MSSLAKVSVVIPCFNAAAYLRAAIESALGQTLRPSEIVVVDDGSTDDSATIAASFGAPVRVIRKENGGVSSARNAGVRSATGDFIAFLDADDLWLPNKLALQVDYLARHGDAVAVGSSFFIRTDGCSDDRLVAIDDRLLRRLRPIDFLTVTHDTPHIATILAPTAIARRVAFPEEMSASEDTAYLALLRTCGTIGAVPEPLSIYRKHVGQATSDPSFAKRNYTHRLAFVDAHYAELGLDSAEAGRREVLEEAVKRLRILRWRRDLAGYRNVRTWLREIWPAGRPMPPELLWPVPPLWVFRAWDRIGRMLLKRARTG